MNEMLAVRVHSFGDIDRLVLEKTPVPTATGDDVLVRVCAAGVGPWDALVRTGGSGLPQPLPLTPGSDIAGIVEASGDAIFGVTNPSFTGGYAQYALAARSSIARKPASLTFVEAASVPVVAVTAWQMLFDHAKISAGETVLVHGAAGNVGAYAVRLCRWAGARVIAVASAADAGYARGLGANEVIDYRAPSASKNMPSDVDAVIDTVGGETQARSFAVLKRDGMLVSSVSAPSQELAARYGVRIAYYIVAVSSAELERITQLFDAGVLKANVGVALRLTDAGKAHEMLAGTTSHPRGKIVFLRR